MIACEIIALCLSTNVIKDQQCVCQGAGGVMSCVPRTLCSVMYQECNARLNYNELAGLSSELSPVEVSMFRGEWGILPE